MYKINVVVIELKPPITFVISGLCSDNGPVKAPIIMSNAKSDM